MPVEKTRQTLIRQTLTENVRHLVLEVLRSHKRVEELAAALNHGVNLTAASTKVGVVVEGLPQVVNGLAAGLRARVNEDTDLGLLRMSNTERRQVTITSYLKHLADSVEQPAVRVDLLLVLRLDDKDNLDRYEVVGVVAMGDDQLWGGVD